MEKLIPQTVPEDLTIEKAVIEGTPAKAIAEFARKEKADLIVMATHGRTGLEKLLMGSTAETVLRHAPCQVLVVKPKKIKTEGE